MSVTAPPTSKYLAIYLNDHLMGSTTGTELVKRIADEHRGTEVGNVADALAVEIEEDRNTLIEIMDRLGATQDRAKVAIGWITERAGRLKPNGDLRGRSPLTPLIELEGLSMGIEGKRQLWLALAEVDAVAEQIGRARLDELIARADSQRARVEPHRCEAARQALTAG
jgi:hypothetical protein